MTYPTFLYLTWYLDDLHNKCSQTNKKHEKSTETGELSWGKGGNGPVKKVKSWDEGPLPTYA